MKAKVVTLKGIRTVGPARAHCHRCDWSASSPGGRSGRERVVHESQLHHLTTDHRVGIHTTMNTVYG